MEDLAPKAKPARSAKTGGTAASAAPPAISHNLLGQRLGKKGRDTRERILAATHRLLADPQGMPLSLSAVARESSLAMTTLYLYFSDLSELLLAVLDPIMASAEGEYVAQLRVRWPDETLGEHCLAFVTGFHAFWYQHARILHLRNSYSAGLDERMLRHRVASSRPMIDLLSEQMDGHYRGGASEIEGMAIALLTGIERLVTVITDAHITHATMEDSMLHVDFMLRGQARILELSIRDGREQARRLAAGG